MRLPWGGMPPLINLKSETRKKNWLKSYSIAYLERDLGDLANLTSSLVKTPKLYWVDNGLLRHISGIGYEVITGELFENYIASEMMKYLRTINSDARLSFYRTRSGMEIDFILETPNGLLAIEAKNRESVINKDFSAIRKVLQTTQQNWLGGIVIYRGNKLIKIDENLWAIPSCRFFSGY